MTVFVEPVNWGTATADDDHDIGKNWAGWLIEVGNYTLVLGSWETYYVDLEDCTTSAQLTDWIFQVAGKAWATAEVLAGLVQALSDILHPQATLCSYGSSKRLTKRAIRTRVDAFAEAHPELLVAVGHR